MPRGMTLLLYPSPSRPPPVGSSWRRTEPQNNNKKHEMEQKRARESRSRLPLKNNKKPNKQNNNKKTQKMDQKRAREPRSRLLPPQGVANPRGKRQKARGEEGEGGEGRGGFQGFRTPRARAGEGKPFLRRHRSLPDVVLDHLGWLSLLREGRAKGKCISVFGIIGKLCT